MSGDFRQEIAHEILVGDGVLALQGVERGVVASPLDLETRLQSRADEIVYSFHIPRNTILINLNPAFHLRQFGAILAWVIVLLTFFDQGVFNRCQGGLQSVGVGRGNGF